MPQLKKLRRSGVQYGKRLDEDQLSLCILCESYGATLKNTTKLSHEAAVVKGRLFCSAQEKVVPSSPSDVNNGFSPICFLSVDPQENVALTSRRRSSACTHFDMLSEPTDRNKAILARRAGDGVLAMGF